MICDVRRDFTPLSRRPALLAVALAQGHQSLTNAPQSQTGTNFDVRRSKLRGVPPRPTLPDGDKNRHPEGCRNFSSRWRHCRYMLASVIRTLRRWPRDPAMSAGFLKGPAMTITSFLLNHAVLASCRHMATRACGQERLAKGNSASLLLIAGNPGSAPAWKGALRKPVPPHDRRPSRPEVADAIAGPRRMANTDHVRRILRKTFQHATSCCTAVAGGIRRRRIGRRGLASPPRPRGLLRNRLSLSGREFIRSRLSSLLSPQACRG